MKRFLLFAGRDYYPQQGARDLVASFDAVDPAAAGLALLEGYGADWGHVYDTETEQITLEWRFVATYKENLGPPGWVTAEEYQRRFEAAVGAEESRKRTIHADGPSVARG